MEFKDVNTLIKEWGFEEAINDMRTTPDSVILLVYYLFGRLQSQESELQQRSNLSLLEQNIVNNAYVEALKTKDL